MTKKLEELVDAFVTHVPGPVVAATAVLLYSGLGLALPLSLHWRTEYLVEANAVGTVLAAVLALAWFIVQIQAGHRRHLLEWTTSLRVLDASEFEFLVGELFRREGWAVTETGGVGTPDGNVDLELARGRDRRIVQCKRWTAQPVGVDDIRRFAGTLMRERLNGKAGVFVTLSSFTEQARKEALETGIEVVDNRELVARIEKVRRTEPCPKCGSPMVVDRSTRGWWLRCRASGCFGKRDLGNDPGRAAQLLVESDLRK